MVERKKEQSSKEIKSTTNGGVWKGKSEKNPTERMETIEKNTTEANGSRKKVKKKKWLLRGINGEEREDLGKASVEIEQHKMRIVKYLIKSVDSNTQSPIQTSTHFYLIT